MSNFNCDKCNTAVIDGGSVGYISGCAHCPPEDDRLIVMDFGADEACKGFYRGAFYRSEHACQKGLAVHPITWRDARFQDDMAKTN